MLYEACKINRWWIGEISIKEDHVHIIIQIKARESIAEVIQILKGGTSRVIRKEFTELEDFFGEIVFGQMAILPRRLEKWMKKL